MFIAAGAAVDAHDLPFALQKKAVPLPDIDRADEKSLWPSRKEEKKKEKKREKGEELSKGRPRRRKGGGKERAERADRKDAPEAEGGLISAAFFAGFLRQRAEEAEEKEQEVGEKDSLRPRAPQSNKRKGKGEGETAELPPEKKDEAAAPRKDGGEKGERREREQQNERIKEQREKDTGQKIGKERKEEEIQSGAVERKLEEMPEHEGKQEEGEPQTAAEGREEEGEQHLELSPAMGKAPASPALRKRERKQRGEAQLKARVKEEKGLKAKEKEEGQGEGREHIIASFGGPSEKMEEEHDESAEDGGMCSRKNTVAEDQDPPEEAGIGLRESEEAEKFIGGGAQNGEMEAGNREKMRSSALPEKRPALGIEFSALSEKHGLADSKLLLWIECAQGVREEIFPALQKALPGGCAVSEERKLLRAERAAQSLCLFVEGKIEFSLISGPSLRKKLPAEPYALSGNEPLLPFAVDEKAPGRTEIAGAKTRIRVLRESFRASIGAGEHGIL